MPSASILGWCYQTKEQNTHVHEKEDIAKGVCWSITKTVGHYSNCREPLYLYFLDNAMFRWLKINSGRENDCIVLRKGTLIAFKQHSRSDMTNMKGEITGPRYSSSNKKGHPNCFHFLFLSSALLTLSMGLKSCMKKKLFPFVLCVKLMTLFMTTREEMF